MSLSSGKASGKPTEDELIGGNVCPLGEFHDGRTYQLVRHDRRIAELEAELEAFRGKPSGKAAMPSWEALHRQCQERLRILESNLSEAEHRAEDWCCDDFEQTERAEKAEAEVERLRTEIRVLSGGPPPARGVTSDDAD